MKLSCPTDILDIGNPPEWLDTNGRGGYASCPIHNQPTRKYHAFLTADLPAPASGKHVLLTTLEPVLSPMGGPEFPLWRLPRAETPALPRPQTLRDFSLETGPVWTFAGDDWTLECRLLLLAGRNAGVLRFLLHGNPAGARLRLSPWLAWRRNHALAQQNEFLDPNATPMPNGLEFHPYAGMPPLLLTLDYTPFHWVPAPRWQRVHYSEEERRGYPADEDLFCPGALVCPLEAGRPLTLAFGAEPVESPRQAFEQEQRRRTQQSRTRREFTRKYARDSADEELLYWLDRAADQFLVVNPEGLHTVPAGYHWFDDWGRDTLIALPGLCFVRGKLDTGRAVLETFLDREKNGLLPNYIGAGDPAYNSVDAALWLFWCLRRFLDAGGNLEWIADKAWPVMKRILAGLASGAAGLTRLEQNGLLSAGTPETQLTWMDAVVDGRPVTPRWGAPIEINALWRHALVFSCECAARFGDAAWRCPVPPELTAETLRSAYTLPDRPWLADRLDEQGPDPTFRPNQVIALALPTSPFPPDTARRALHAVRETLLTPRGLRTLAPDAPEYRGRYEGDCRSRDSAYHQGTAWPWLLGHFGEAWIRFFGRNPENSRFLLEHWRGWASHLREAGIGTVSEVFDGDPPQRPGGCIAQAWSVAELLRLGLLLLDPTARAARSCES